jgi:hypothetical protein
MATDDAAEPDDYADRWAERERLMNMLSRADQISYSMGLSHAYTDVFYAFTAAFTGAIPYDIRAVFERVCAQWDDVSATQTVRGTI